MIRGKFAEWISIALKVATKKGGCTGGCHILKMHLKLAEYEDAEENGLLIHLPCRVGDTVYFHWRCSDETTIVCPATVKEICVGTYMLRKTIKYKIEPKGNCGMIKIFYASDWGDTIFTTGEAAEKALAKMGE